MAANLARSSREELWKLCYTWWVPAYMYSQYPTCFYSFEWLLLGGCGWYLYIYLVRRKSDNSLPILTFQPPVILPSSIPACSVLTLPLNRIEALHLLLHRFTSLAHLEVMNEHISQISCSPVFVFHHQRSIVYKWCGRLLLSPSHSKIRFANYMLFLIPFHSVFIFLCSFLSFIYSVLLPLLLPHSLLTYPFHSYIPFVSFHVLNVVQWPQCDQN